MEAESSVVLFFFLCFRLLAIDVRLATPPLMVGLRLVLEGELGGAAREAGAGFVVPRPTDTDRC